MSFISQQLLCFCLKHQSANQFHSCKGKNMKVLLSINNFSVSRVSLTMVHLFFFPLCNHHKFFFFTCLLPDTSKGPTWRWSVFTNVQYSKDAIFAWLVFIWMKRRRLKKLFLKMVRFTPRYVDLRYLHSLMAGGIGQHFHLVLPSSSLVKVAMMLDESNNELLSQVFALVVSIPM